MFSCTSRYTLPYQGSIQKSCSGTHGGLEYVAFLIRPALGAIAAEAKASLQAVVFNEQPTHIIAEPLQLEESEAVISMHFKVDAKVFFLQIVTNRGRRLTLPIGSHWSGPFSEKSVPAAHGAHYAKNIRKYLLVANGLSTFLLDRSQTQTRIDALEDSVLLQALVARRRSSVGSALDDADRQAAEQGLYDDIYFITLADTQAKLQGPTLSRDLHDAALEDRTFQLAIHRYPGRDLSLSVELQTVYVVPVSMAAFLPSVSVGTAHEYNSEAADNMLLVLTQFARRNVFISNMNLLMLRVPMNAANALLDIAALSSADQSISEEAQGRCTSMGSIDVARFIARSYRIRLSDMTPLFILTVAMRERCDAPGASASLANSTKPIVTHKDEHYTIKEHEWLSSMHQTIILSSFNGTESAVSVLPVLNCQPVQEHYAVREVLASNVDGDVLRSRYRFWFRCSADLDLLKLSGSVYVSDGDCVFSITLDRALDAYTEVDISAYLYHGNLNIHVDGGAQLQQESERNTTEALFIHASLIAEVLKKYANFSLGIFPYVNSTAAIGGAPSSCSSPGDYIQNALQSILYASQEAFGREDVRETAHSNQTSVHSLKLYLDQCIPGLDSAHQNMLLCDAFLIASASFFGYPEHAISPAQSHRQRWLYGQTFAAVSTCHEKKPSLILSQRHRITILRCLADIANEIVDHLLSPSLTVFYATKQFSRFRTLSSACELLAIILHTMFYQFDQFPDVLEHLAIFLPVLLHILRTLCPVSSFPLTPSGHSEHSELSVHQTPEILSWSTNSSASEHFKDNSGEVPSASAWLSKLQVVSAKHSFSLVGLQSLLLCCVSACSIIIVTLRKLEAQPGAHDGSDTSRNSSCRTHLDTSGNLEVSLSEASIRSLHVLVLVGHAFQSLDTSSMSSHTYNIVYNITAQSMHRLSLVGSAYIQNSQGPSSWKAASALLSQLSIRNASLLLESTQDFLLRLALIRHFYFLVSDSQNANATEEILDPLRYLVDEAIFHAPRELVSFTRSVQESTDATLLNTSILTDAFMRTISPLYFHPRYSLSAIFYAKSKGAINICKLEPFVNRVLYTISLSNTVSPISVRYLVKGLSDRDLDTFITNLYTSEAKFIKHIDRYYGALCRELLSRSDARVVEVLCSIYHGASEDTGLPSPCIALTYLLALDTVTEMSLLYANPLEYTAIYRNRMNKLVSRSSMELAQREYKAFLHWSCQSLIAYNGILFSEALIRKHVSLLFTTVIPFLSLVKDQVFRRKALHDLVAEACTTLDSSPSSEQRTMIALIFREVLLGNSILRDILVSLSFEDSAPRAEFVLSSLNFTNQERLLLYDMYVGHGSLNTIFQVSVE